MATNDVQRYIEQRSQRDEAFAQAWEDSKPEYEIMKLVVEGRQSCGLSQQEVADRCGMKQSNISRLENGNGNPTISTFKNSPTVSGRSSRFGLYKPSRRYFNVLYVMRTGALVDLHSPSSN